MPRVAALRGVGQAVRELERMSYQDADWDSVHGYGHRTLKKVLDEYIETARRSRLAELEARGFEDRHSCSWAMVAAKCPFVRLARA